MALNSLKPVLSPECGFSEETVKGSYLSSWLVHTEYYSPNLFHFCWFHPEVLQPVAPLSVAVPPREKLTKHKKPIDQKFNLNVHLGSKK